ncbi:hypothetical protein BN1723_015227 [Verticillium longisporum]|uniref:Uncharacterized protein n=1 Tax=Verticillium longisporum TaxID=100787 RepID=A0A0G4MUG6_VERLO|nr:hypothetical protein BN1723_015227 [Verticillium longisporum]
MAERSSPEAKGQEIVNPSTPSPRKREINPGSAQPSKGRSLATPSSNDEPDSPRLLSSQAKSPPTYPAPSWHKRHLKLPFDLRDRNVKFDNNVLRVLYNIFPDTVDVLEGGNRHYLHFTVKKLPEAPWPLTIAGLPITIGDNEGNGKGTMFPMTMAGNMSIRICDDTDARFMPLESQAFRSLAESVTRAILTCVPGLAVLEFILDAERRFHVVLEDGVDINSVWARLPGRIAKCWTMYLFETDLRRPSPGNRQALLRQVMPNPGHGIVDDTAYNVIGLVNDAGDKFMTGASHGIGESETFHQTLPSGDKRLLGRAVEELSFTNISLVELQPGVQFVNEPFEQQGETVPPFTRLLGEDMDDKIDIADRVFLNSPQTGAMEGLMMAKGWKMHRNDSETTHLSKAQLRYVIYDWVYIGQIEPPRTDLIIPYGTCRSATWDEQGRVTGFFQYQVVEGPMRGFYASVSADEVVKAGYRLG